LTLLSVIKTLPEIKQPEKIRVDTIARYRKDFLNISIFLHAGRLNLTK